MKTLSIQAARVGHSDCANCGMREIALFANLNEETFSQLHLPIDDLEIPADTLLFRQGNLADHMFTIRSGLLKVVRLNDEGAERILRILRMGDLTGLEASLGSATYQHSVVTLNKVRVCRIPVSVISDLSQRISTFHKSLMGKWAKALYDSETWIAEMNTGTARQRVARLLLSIRQPINTYHGIITSTLFKREDIGAMLDITLETASRVLSALMREGILKRPTDVHGPVQILDVYALEQIAKGA